MWTLFYRDLWGPVWPNLAANVVWAAPVIWMHVKHRKHLRHISNKLAELTARLEEDR